MPELPEVETVKRSLEPLLLGQRILQVRLYYPSIIKRPPAEAFLKDIDQRTFESINRRGKYLLFMLEGGLTLVIHLRMTGQVLLCDPCQALDKHTHLVFSLSNGQEMRYVDIRKFGMIYLVPNGYFQDIKGLAALGVEPLVTTFTVKKLTQLVKGTKKGLKAFLLDQTKVAGIGNIYADEILHASRLHPEKRVHTLTRKEIKVLHESIVAKLQQGVDHRGTTISDYVDAHGQKGEFQQCLAVYDRGGQPCQQCGTLLIKTVVAGRGSVFCPRCQRPPDCT